MTKYFHIAPNMLGEGTVVLPGNFGRNLKAYSVGPRGPEGHFLNLARELIFESVRNQYHPEKVSRFEACFLFESYEDVRRFGHYIYTSGVIYEASIVNQDAKIHRGDFSMFQDHTLQQQISFIELHEGQAKDYWANPPQVRIGANGAWGVAAEILTDSPIRLERQIGFVNDPVL
ncbi:DUF2441 domain-containing protein [Pseudomonas sp. B21-048]|uniref:DUF2441 domain-containing protein n=1 Tax=Pseudomonas sp. B21-048 TaxID=2895490 RepID=UPI00215EFA42|nr:DUF2441 domain-containing protein [Pseudomonas sp. B21-048]UVK96486.1 DUF2441 domain-containing protein [Pseudomonas sp. B21-048]